MKCPECGKEYTDRDVATDEGKGKSDISISVQHAYSLSELVRRFKMFIDFAYIPKTETRSDEWTQAYCDELLEDLNG